MRMLMLVPHATVRGPMPRILDLLREGLESLGVEVLTTPWGRHRDDESTFEKVVGRMADVRRVRRVVRRSAPDLVVVQTSHEWRSMLRDLPLLLAIRRSAPRIVLQFHGGRAGMLATPGERLFKRATALLLRLSDGALVLSQDDARAITVFRPSARVEVVANPHEAQPAESGGDSRTAPGDGLGLLFVGRLIAGKGIFDAIDALALLGARRARLVVAGDGPAAREAALRAESLGVRGSVSFEGHLSPAALERAYAAADVFVLPTHAEGFPTAIAEAMAAGLAIVTTGVGGIPDHLAEGRNALFVPPGDARALAEAIERLAEDAGLRHAMAEANRRDVKRFEPGTVAREYLRALAALRERSGAS